MTADDGKHLVVRDLHVDYGRIRALEDVSLDLPAGSATAVVGRNGAGKTTLLKAIAGLLPEADGTISWGGRPLASSERRALVGYLPQRGEIDWDFPITVRGLVEMGLYPLIGNWGRLRAAHRERAAQALARMGLASLASRRIGELSGGQQQRAFLARAIAGGARILLLDEPFAGLDREAGEKLGRIFRDLTAAGALILASHHDLNSVGTLFDRTLLLRSRPLAFGPTAEVLTDEAIRETFA
ncbi:MAG: metal ABC transporter ATP-binding protein [Puniceicoccaceae bacterium]